MYKILLILSILSISSLKAKHINFATNSKPQTRCLQSKPSCDILLVPTIAAYNSSARIDVCGSKDAFVTASFIYWKIE